MTLANVAIGLCVWLGVIALYQAIFALWFGHVVAHAQASTVPEERLPSVLVLMSLRGWDDNLAETLHSLLTQDYPRYEVRIIVDSSHDPCWEAVNRIVAETPFPHVHLETLVDRLPSCSLKCSALVQMTRSLPDRVGAVAICDADSNPPRRWLRELISPMIDSPVGLTFGNRWFTPMVGWPGSLVRATWNGAMVSPMYVLGTPWGGSMAVRGDVFREIDAPEQWARSMVEDTPLRAAVMSKGLKIRFVPTLMHFNTEDCSLGGAMDFFVRQMSWNRLYARPVWRVLQGGTAAFIGTLLVLVGLMIHGAWQGDTITVWWCATSLAIYHFNAACLLGLLEWSVRIFPRRQGDHVPGSFRQYLRAAALIPLTEAVHVISLLIAHWKRTYTWRGVKYHVDGPGKVSRGVDSNAKECQNQLSSPSS